MTSRATLFRFLRCLFLGTSGVLSAACGSGSQVRPAGQVETPKLPPVSPRALREFDAGLRAVRLRGPEAMETAKKRLQKATELDGRMWEAWHNLGVVFVRLNRDREAVSAYARALEINPAHTPSLIGRAEAYRRLGTFKAARKDYEAVIAARGSAKSSARARLASLLRENGAFEDGLDVLREALRVEGESSQVYVELGLIYLAQGRDDLANLVLKKAASFGGSDPSVYNALALAAQAGGQSQAAFNLFDKATSLDPTFVDARYNKASVLLGAGDYARAAAELELVRETNTDDHAATVALGIAYRGLEKLGEARTLWSKVVSSAADKSRARDDALYNLAILDLDFVMDEKKGLKALDRFLHEADPAHPKYREAGERRKELGL